MKPINKLVRRALAALIVLVLLTGVALLWPRERTSIGHKVTLSNGTTLTLRQVTCGKEHRYRGTNAWQHLVALLPAKLADRLDKRRSVLTPSASRISIAFWLECRGPWPSDPQLVLCDVTGFGTCGGYTMMRLGPAGNCVEGWAYEFWPRREKTFTLQIYERGKRYPDAQLVGEYSIVNPKPDRYPVWTAPPLPTTTTDGDLSVTLFDMVAGVGHGSLKWKPAANLTVSSTRAGFRIERHGAPTREWEITSVETSDATGNMISRQWGTSSEPDCEYAELSPHLWPAESAWKLHVGLTQRSNFPPAEIWVLPPVPIPESRPPQLHQTNVQGVLVQYTGQERKSYLKGDHQFNFKFSPGKDYRLTLARAVDDQGREVEQLGHGEGLRDWTFAVNVKPGATNVTLTVALHRTRYFDFVARPQVASTNAPAKP